MVGRLRLFGKAMDNAKTLRTQRKNAKVAEAGVRWLRKAVRLANTHLRLDEAEPKMGHPDCGV